MGSPAGVRCIWYTGEGRRGHIRTELSSTQTDGMVHTVLATEAAARGQ